MEWSAVEWRGAAVFTTAKNVCKAMLERSVDSQSAHAHILYVGALVPACVCVWFVVMRATRLWRAQAKHTLMSTGTGQSGGCHFGPQPSPSCSPPIATRRERYRGILSFYAFQRPMLYSANGVVEAGCCMMMEGNHNGSTSQAHSQAHRSSPGQAPNGLLADPDLCPPLGEKPGCGRGGEAARLVTQDCFVVLYDVHGHSGQSLVPSPPKKNWRTPIRLGLNGAEAGQELLSVTGEPASVDPQPPSVTLQPPSLDRNLATQGLKLSSSKREARNVSFLKDCPGGEVGLHAEVLVTATHPHAPMKASSSSAGIGPHQTVLIPGQAQGPVSPQDATWHKGHRGGIT